MRRITKGVGVEMVEAVFEEKKREYHGPAKDADTAFTSLDRSACRHSNFARRAVNRWFQTFAAASKSPAKNQSLLASFRDSKRTNRFNEALLETVTLQLLLATGMDVVVEPTFDQQGGLSPDYLLRSENLEFLVECNVRRGQEDPTTSQAVRQLWDWVNENVDTMAITS